MAPTLLRVPALDDEGFDGSPTLISVGVVTAVFVVFSVWFFFMGAHSPPPCKRAKIDQTAPAPPLHAAPGPHGDLPLSAAAVCCAANCIIGRDKPTQHFCTVCKRSVHNVCSTHVERAGTTEHRCNDSDAIACSTAAGTIDPTAAAPPLHATPGTHGAAPSTSTSTAGAMAPLPIGPAPKHLSVERDDRLRFGQLSPELRKLCTTDVANVVAVLQEKGVKYASDAYVLNSHLYECGVSVTVCVCKCVFDVASAQYACFPMPAVCFVLTTVHDFANLCPAVAREYPGNPVSRDTPIIKELLRRNNSNVALATGGRSMPVAWLEAFEWLCFSKDKGAAFCSTCVAVHCPHGPEGAPTAVAGTLFSHKVSRSFIYEGFTVFARRDRLEDHQSSRMHAAAVNALDRIASGKVNPPQADIVAGMAKLNEQAKKQLEEKRVASRIILEHSIEVARFLATNELAFRGREEESCKTFRNRIVTEITNKQDVYAYKAGLYHQARQVTGPSAAAKVVNGAKDGALDEYVECDVYTSSNGNFLELMEERIRDNTTLFEAVKQAPGNAMYMSPKIQNAIIAAIAWVILNLAILPRILKMPFSVSADEATCFDKEILSITIRSSCPFTLIPTEYFLGCVEIVGTPNAETISTAIWDFLVAKGLDPVTYLIMCSLDGASVMSGHISGVAARLKQRTNGRCVYCHCHSHRLNLAVVQALGTDETRAMSWAVDTYDETVKSFDNQPKRLNALKSEVTAHRARQAATGDHHVQTDETALKTLCRTRWLQRLSGLEVLVHLFVPIVMCCRRIARAEGGSWASDTRTKFQGIMDAVTTYKFIVCVQTLLCVLGIVAPLTKQLQGRAAEVAQAYMGIRALKDRLHAMRGEQLKLTCDIVLAGAKAACESVAPDFNIKPEIPRQSAWQTLRANPPVGGDEDFPQHQVPDGATEAHRVNILATNAQNAISSYYKRTVIIPCLDSLVSTMERSFVESGPNATAAHLCVHIVPLVIVDDFAAWCAARPGVNIELAAFATYWWDTYISPGLLHYATLMHTAYGILPGGGGEVNLGLKMEVMQWAQLWARPLSAAERRVTDVPGSVQDCNVRTRNNMLWVRLRHVLHLAATFMAVSCEAERSFSTMNRVCTRLRASMNVSRMNDLMVIATYKGVRPRTRDVLERLHSEKARWDLPEFI